MPNLIGNPQALEQFIEEHVPLAKASGIKVRRFDALCVSLDAPLALNHNDKLSAFGGSLYVLCVTAAWAMAWRCAQSLNMEGDLVVAKASIEYLAPLREDICACATAPDDNQLQLANKSYHLHGKAIFPIRAYINNRAGKQCVAFEAKYALIKKAE